MEYPKWFPSFLVVWVAIVDDLEIDLIKATCVVRPVEVFIQGLLVHTTNPLPIFLEQTFVIVMSLAKFCGGWANVLFSTRFTSDQIDNIFAITVEPIVHSIDLVSTSQSASLFTCRVGKSNNQTKTTGKSKLTLLMASWMVALSAMAPRNTLSASSRMSSGRSDSTSEL